MRRRSPPKVSAYSNRLFPIRGNANNAFSKNWESILLSYAIRRAKLPIRSGIPLADNSLMKL